MQVDPIGYKDQMNLYAYVGNDPMNHTDPTGTYGMGTGWNDDQWKKFYKVQQRAANAMEKRADKLNAKANKLDAKGKEGGDDLRKAASNLRGGAADLRSTTKTANMVDGKTMDTINGGQCAGGAACAAIGGDSIWVNKDSNTWNSGNNERMGWLLGHESMHSGAGLNDKASNGYFSYIVGDDNQRSTFYGLQGTSEGYEKPDNLMYLVYPGAWPKF